MKLLIGADLVPTESNSEIFSNGDVEKLLGQELFELISNCDIRVFNLEVPLTDNSKPIKKLGPNLRANTSTINGIKRINPTLLTLSNNHILDQGEEGLNTTKKILEENNISYIGAGDDLYEASKPFIVECKGYKIGFYACCEHEFTVVNSKMSGANPFDPLESLDHIMNLSEKCDYVVVLYHGGKENYRYPTPYLQKVCRKMCEKGANLVVCQHSHCIGSIEKFNDSTIVYGQGNFIFDASDRESWKTSILIKVVINESVDIEYIPICKDKNSVRLAYGIEKIEIINELKQRSENIKNKDFITEEYSKIVQEQKDMYLRALAGFNIIEKVINKISRNKLLEYKYNNKKMRAIRNYVECESHRESLLNILTIDEE